MPHGRMTAILIAACFGPVAGAEGQDVPPVCRLCRVSLDQIVTMGDDGDRALGWNQLVAGDGSRYFVSYDGVPDQVPVFGTDGRFEESLGPSRLSRPRSTITSIRMVDGRLWVLGYTGSDIWERARNDGYADLGTYLDNVDPRTPREASPSIVSIDIFDPEDGTLLASTRIDIKHTLIDIKHTLLVTLMPGRRISAQESHPLIDKATIYAARLEGPLWLHR